MRILGIETSCDETAAAVVEETQGRFSVLGNVVASQVKIHAKTGGVVPEVAARAHAEKIIPVIEQALTKLDAAASNFVGMKSGRGIDVIAVTAGPGLATSLLVGVEVARTLSWLWKKPLVAANHLAGHIYANWLFSPRHSEEQGDEESRTNPVRDRTRTASAISNGTNVRSRIRAGSFTAFRMTDIQFPLLCLIVSGGHTEIVLMRKHLDYQVIGETRDDAAGEAFDKVAKILGLGYPGGPAIARQAEQWESEIRNPKSEKNFKFPISKLKPTPCAIRPALSINFPRPMIDSPDFDFSFSGIKTAVLYYVQDLKKQNNMRPHEKLLKRELINICAAFQEAVVDVLVAKTVRAAEKYKVRTVMLGGGVAANARLRQGLGEAIKRKLPTTHYVLPTPQYTTDNAAMIAVAGYFIACAKQFTLWQRIDIDPNWKLGLVIEP